MLKQLFKVDKRRSFRVFNIRRGIDRFNTFGDLYLKQQKAELFLCKFIFKYNNILATIINTDFAIVQKLKTILNRCEIFI